MPPKPNGMHWITKELRVIMKEKKLTPRDLEQLIQKKHGIRIPANTIKYWFYGHSNPKVNEAELMAEVLGYEIDLMQKEREQTGGV